MNQAHMPLRMFLESWGTNGGGAAEPEPVPELPPNHPRPAWLLIGGAVPCLITW